VHVRVAVKCIDVPRENTWHQYVVSIKVLHQLPGGARKGKVPGYRDTAPSATGELYERVSGKDVTRPATFSAVFLDEPLQGPPVREFLADYRLVGSVQIFSDGVVGRGND
jgi:hypothetical protein